MNFFISLFSRICRPFGRTQFFSFFPASAEMIKIEFENETFLARSIKIEFTSLPESASFESVLYNPFIESKITKWGFVASFVKILGRIWFISDSNVENNVRLGIVRSFDLTYPEKRKSRSTYKIGRLCLDVISLISLILENAFS